jgi:membrane protein YdbS with pleckstrin-like domain
MNFTLYIFLLVVINSLTALIWSYSKKDNIWWAIGRNIFFNVSLFVLLIVLQ